MKFLFILSILLSAPLANAQEEINFDASKAIQQWVMGTSDKYMGYLDASLPFEYALQIGLDRVIKSSTKWHVEKIVSYASYRAYPVAELELTISQRPLTKKKIPSGSNYFIYRKSDPSQHLVIDARYGDIHYNSEKKELALAEEFRSDIMKEMVAVYRSGALEFKESEQVGFIEGVSKYKYTWDDLILSSELKAQLLDGIDSFLVNYDYATWKKYGLPLSQGALLHGPPGTGKSMLGKVIISNVINGLYKDRITYIHVQARHVDEAADVRTVFQVARLINPSVVFIEDIDLIAGTDRQDRADVKNELMQQLSGIEALEGVLTVGTTNVADKIDPALKRSKRLGLHYLMDRPVYKERVELFKVFLNNIGGEDLDYGIYANASEQLTGADIKQIVSTASDFAIKDKSFNASRLFVNHKHLLSAIELRKKTRLIKD